LIELLQPLADAVYETYNSLFTTPDANNSQPAPAAPVNQGDGNTQ
jgi:hypothetical protein